MSVKHKGKVEFELFLYKLSNLMLDEINSKNQNAELSIVAGLKESDINIAEKLVNIQKLKGFIVSGDLDDSERMRIHRIAEKYNISTKEAISKLATNINYVSSEINDARRMLKLISEIKALYDEYYDKYKAIPICMMSGESRQFLFNKHFDIPAKEQVEMIVQKFLPELGCAQIEEFCFEVRNNKKREYALDSIKQNISKIKELSDEKGNVDRIFLLEHRAFLSSLISDLRKAKVTFDDYIINYCDLSYTRIYECDPSKAVRHMIAEYIKRFDTPTHFRENDPYLESKINIAKQKEAKFSLSSILISLGFVPSHLDKKGVLSKNQIKEREDVLLNKLKIMFPNGVISSALSSNYERISDEIIFLAARKGFSTVNEYLKSIGFERVGKKDIKLGNFKILLTENDLLRYNFVTEEELMNFESLGIIYDARLADVEGFMKTYSNMIQKEKNGANRVDYRCFGRQNYKI